MGFRFRKSFKILPGVRINLSKTGIGASVGVPGARHTWRADGRRQRTLSIPGTGLSHVTELGARKRRSRRSALVCTDCGAKAPNSANFCANCGAELA